VASFADLDDFTAGDGARLALRRETPRGAHRAGLILVHGWGEHTGRYTHVAAWLAERGIAVFAVDQRGAGHTPGPRGHVTRFAQYLADIVALRRLVHAEAPGPLLLLGHSHGGLIVLRYLETAPEGVAGAILTSPWIALATPPPRWKVGLAGVLADVVPSIRVPTGLNLDHICTDEDVVARAKADPWCHQVMTPRAYREIRSATQHVLAERNRITVPLFIGLPGDDRIISAPATQAFAAGLHGDVTLRTYGGMYHEILNEREQGRVFADLAPWMDRALAGSGAGAA
jgi:lysophospholipase